MILNEEQHDVLELLKLHLVKDGFKKNIRAIDIIEEILISGEI